MSIIAWESILLPSLDPCTIEVDLDMEAFLLCKDPANKADDLLPLGMVMAALGVSSGSSVDLR